MSRVLIGGGSSPSVCAPNLARPFCLETSRLLNKAAGALPLTTWGGVFATGEGSPRKLPKYYAQTTSVVRALHLPNED